MVYLIALLNHSLVNAQIKYGYVVAEDEKVIVKYSAGGSVTMKSLAYINKIREEADVGIMLTVEVDCSCDGIQIHKLDAVLYYTSPPTKYSPLKCGNNCDIKSFKVTRFQTTMRKHNVPEKNPSQETKNTYVTLGGTEPNTSSDNSSNSNQQQTTYNPYEHQRQLDAQRDEIMGATSELSNIISSAITQSYDSYWANVAREREQDRRNAERRRAHIKEAHSKIRMEKEGRINLYGSKIRGTSKEQRYAILKKISMENGKIVKKEFNDLTDGDFIKYRENFELSILIALTLSENDKRKIIDSLKNSPVFEYKFTKKIKSLYDPKHPFYKNGYLIAGTILVRLKYITSIFSIDNEFSIRQDKDGFTLVGSGGKKGDTSV